MKIKDEKKMEYISYKHLKGSAISKNPYLYENLPVQTKMAICQADGYFLLQYVVV